MPKRSRPFSPFPMLREAWSFFWKQPALLRVAFVMMGLPSFLGAILIRVMDPRDPFSGTGFATFIATNDPDALSPWFMGILLALVYMWGICGIAVVGRRMITTKSGRARTSFSSVLKEALPFVRPVVACALVSIGLLSLPLIASFALASYVEVPYLAWLGAVPSLVIGVYIAFATTLIICEERTTSRRALRDSIGLVYGKFWRTFWCIAVFFLCYSIPVAALTYFSVPLTTGIIAEAISDFVIEMLISIFDSIFLVLCFIVLYGKLKAAPKEVKL